MYIFSTLILVILVIALRADRLDSGSSPFQAAMISMIFLAQGQPRLLAPDLIECLGTCVRR